jgi:hypothetical protein
MPIEAGTGKQCTISIDSTAYTAWVETFDTSGAKSSSTESTWGEDVQFNGTPEYTASIAGMFDPNETSLGAVLEEAFGADSQHDIATDYFGAGRVFTDWRVVAYSDNAPADGLVKFTAELSGSAKWVTTYKPTT